VDVFYTVQPSDESEGLLGIAHRLYGDMSRWPEIYEANQSVIGNNPNIIHVGQQLVIASFEDGRITGEGMRVYVVQAADTWKGLRGLARTLCGSEEWWQEIYDINHGVIGNNPAYLQAGQILIIPRVTGDQ
jgi:nucleoid-associated protein YgaU